MHYSTVPADPRVSSISSQLLKPEILSETISSLLRLKPLPNQKQAKSFLPSLLFVYTLSLLFFFFFSYPFPKHEQFTVNSIFPRLGSLGTALEFRFVMIKWLHGIVFLGAPPSTFIRICHCWCRSSSQSALLATLLPPPSTNMVIPYEIRRSWHTHNLITSARLKIYWIFFSPPLRFTHLNPSLYVASSVFIYTMFRMSCLVQQVRKA